MGLFDTLKAQNGFTVSLDGKPVPTTGFVCGGMGAEFVADVDKFSELDILRFVRDNAQNMERDTYFGGWLSDNKVYLDICRIFDNIEEAVQAGKLLAQKAIYDLATGKDIYL